MQTEGGHSQPQAQPVPRPSIESRASEPQDTDTFPPSGAPGENEKRAGWIALSLPFLEEKMVNDAVSHH